MWAHMLLSYVRTMRVREPWLQYCLSGAQGAFTRARVHAGQIRGLNPRTKKWEPYTRLTRLARWGCSLLIHMLESVVRLMQRIATPATRWHSCPHTAVAVRRTA